MDKAGGDEPKVGDGDVAKYGEAENMNVDKDAETSELEVSDAPKAPRSRLLPLMRKAMNVAITRRRSPL